MSRRRKEKRKSSAVRGSPSDHWASLRSSKIHSSGREGSTGYHFSATPGIAIPSLEGWASTSPSKSERIILLSRTPLTIWGSNPFGSPLFPMISIPFREASSTLLVSPHDTSRRQKRTRIKKLPVSPK